MPIIENKQLGFIFEFVVVDKDIWCDGKNICKYLKSSQYQPWKNQCKYAEIFFEKNLPERYVNYDTCSDIMNFSYVLYALQSEQDENGVKFREWIYNFVTPHLLEFYPFIYRG
jgi:hypothetical protein